MEVGFVEGLIQPPGLVHIEAARADGRWESAYAGSAEMVIPDDFLDELRATPAAYEFYQTLNRANLFAIYHRIATAKRAQTRQKRITAIVAQLSRGETFH